MVASDIDRLAEYLQVDGVPIPREVKLFQLVVTMVQAVLRCDDAVALDICMRRFLDRPTCQLNVGELFMCPSLLLAASFCRVSPASHDRR